jgi:hypothetical protein
MTSTQIIRDRNNALVQYNVENSFDVNRVMEMERVWSAEMRSIIADIIAKNPACINDPQLWVKLLAENNIEDMSWNWMAKAMHLNKQDYCWFFLIADNKVQAACIIYHPKKSLIDSENIFYVDYLATAVWNRNRPGHIRQFSGLARILLAHSIRHAINLGYRPGFCLHSLPLAESFYSSLGMLDFGIDTSKENLKLFEAKKESSIAIMEEFYVE